MSSLSGQTIQSTYPSLLKLADSTSGITSVYQQIQDGLGNDIGVELKDGYILDNHHYSKTNFKPTSLGAPQISSSTTQYVGMQNILLAIPVYDDGVYVYSSITIDIKTGTTSSDVITAAFYDSQMSSKGLMPRNVIMSGITIPSTRAVHTVTLPSDLSFSASPGINYFGFIINNAGVSPTVRFSETGQNNLGDILQMSYGFEFQNQGAQSYTMASTTDTATAMVAFSGFTSFPTIITEGDILTKQRNQTFIGFGISLNLK